MANRDLEAPRAIGLALVVGAFFTAEEVFMDLARHRPELTGRDLANGVEFWLVWAALAPVCLVAARRWPFVGPARTRALVPHIATGLTLALLHNVIVIVMQSIVAWGQGQPVAGMAAVDGANPTAFVWGVFTGVIFYAMLVMVFTSLRLRRLYFAEQLSAAALETELARSKLDTLRSQLRPHFLFNTLNAISVFVMEDTGKAQQMILRLSTLLRRSLDEEAHEVTLERELAFVNDYLDIQRGRFGDDLIVNVAVDPGVLAARVPVFLLQPLLENAIEHGKSEERPTTIALGAARVHDELRITLADDGPGLDEGAVAREGIGLTNTRARLRQLYDERAAIDIGPVRGTPGAAGARVEIRLPFRTGAG